MKTADFTHVTRLVPVKNGILNLEKAVTELLAEGLYPNPKNITVFIYLDGFKVVLLPGQELMVEVDGKNYPLVIVPVVERPSRHSGEIQLKYDAL